VRVDAVHAAQKSGPVAAEARPIGPDVEMAGTDAFRTAAIAGLVATVVDLFVCCDGSRAPAACARPAPLPLRYLPLAFSDTQ
jgi:hypothetical protein